MRPGPRNTITDVPGILVGNAEDHRARSGVTVVLPEEPAIAAVDARGGGTGSRDIELLGLDGSVEEVNAIVLSGGSAFGLDAAGGGHVLAGRAPARLRRRRDHRSHRAASDPL